MTTAYISPATFIPARGFGLVLRGTSFRKAMADVTCATSRVGRKPFCALVFVGSLLLSSSSLILQMLAIDAVPLAEQQQRARALLRGPRTCS